MVEARWRQLIVSSDHPSADERVDEAIARVLSRYAVGYSSGVDVVMPHEGVRVAYQARTHPMRLLTVRRAAMSLPPVLDVPLRIERASASVWGSARSSFIGSPPIPLSSGTEANQEP
jgi:hypothetical protein